MPETVGHAEVDVDLDTAGLAAQARNAAQNAGEAFGSEFERRTGRVVRGLRFDREGSAVGATFGAALGRSASRSISRSLLRANPFTGLSRQFQRESANVLATAVRLGPAIVAALAVATSIAPAIAASLPALGAVAAAVGIIALAWDDVKDAVEPIGDLFERLQGPIGDILTDGVRPLVAELAGNLFPILREGLGDIAGVMNETTRAFLEWANSAEALGILEDLLAGIVPAFERLGSIAPLLAEAFGRIAVAALPAFRALTEIIASLAEDFANWIIQLDRTGALTEEISAAAARLGTVLSDVGRLLGPIVGLLFDLGPAAIAAFSGIVDVIVAIVDVLRPLARLLSRNTDALRTFGQAFATLLLASVGLQVLIAVLSGAVGAVAALAAAFTIAFQNSEGFRDAVAQVGQFIQTQLVPALQQAWVWIQQNVVPALQDAARWIQDSLIPALQDLWSWIQANIIPALQTLASIFQMTVIPVLQDVWEAIQPFVEALQRLFEVLQPILGPLARLAVIIAGLAVLAPLVAGLVALRITLAILTPFINAVAFALETVRDVAMWLWRNILQPLAAFLAGRFRQSWRIARTAVAAAATAVRIAATAITNAVATIRGAISSAINFVVGLLRDAWSGAWQTAVSIVTNSVGAIVRVIQQVIDAIQEVIDFVGDMISAIAGISVAPVTALITAFGQVRDAISNAIDTVGDLASQLGALDNTVIDIVVNITSNLIGEGFELIDPSLLPGIGAMGGIFERPTNMIIGEAGPEVLVPLTKPRRAMELMEASGAAGMVREHDQAAPARPDVNVTQNITMPTTDPNALRQIIGTQLAAAVR